MTTIQKEVDEPIINPSHLLALDLGERYLVTSCGNNGIKPKFLGREVKEILRHYAWLRMLTVHPLKEGQKNNRIASGRWVRI